MENGLILEEKAFIQNKMKKLSFDIGTFVYFVTSFLDTRHYSNVYNLFFIRTSKIGPWACSPIFLIFRNTLMIYNNRNRSNDTTESQKEKRLLMLIFSTVSQKSRD